MITTPGLTVKAPPSMSAAGLRVKIDGEDDVSVHSSNGSKHSKEKRTSRMSMIRTPVNWPVQQPQQQHKYSNSAPVVKLPLIGAAPKVPENTLAAINQSIKTSSKKSKQPFQQPGVAAAESYAMEFDEGEIGEHAFSVSSIKGGGGAVAGLPASVLKSVSTGSLAQVSFNKHGNIAR